MIEAQNITVAYGKHSVINKMNVKFESGKLTAIIGPNGCGKSTLLKTLIGILPTKQGQVFIDGVPLSSMNTKSVARKLSYLPQIKPIPDMTVEELVLHGRFPHLNHSRRYSKKDWEIASSAMKQMKIDEIASKPVSTLSGGMRQNAFIAMALAQDTDYILMDEPTTHLDIGNSIKLMTLLKDLAENYKGIVAVLHDIAFALEYADNIVVMQNGEVIASDTAINVYNSGIIDEVFDVKLRKIGSSFYYEK